MADYVNALPSDEESCYYAEHLEFRTDPNADPLFSDDDLAAVLPHCPHITSAFLSGIRDLSSRTLILLAEHADELAYLDVSGCAAVTNLGLQAIATRSTSLRAINVSRIFGTTDAAIAALVRGLPHLAELDMDMLPLVTALATRDVWTYAKKLRRWSLSGCKNVTDSGFPWVPGRERLEAAREEREGGRHRSWMESLPPLVLPPIYLLNDLRFLDLSHCARITDAAVLGVVAHAPRIATLNVAGCIELTDIAMQKICELGEHLTNVDVAGLEKVTDAGVLAIASACKRLRSVDISCQYAPPPIRSTSITILRTNAEPNVAQSRAKIPRPFHPNVVIPGLTDLAVLELATLPRLQRLAAAGLPLLTDHAAFSLAEHAFGLAHLHLSFCARLTLDGVQALLRRLTKLEHLSLSGVPAMRRRGVARFSEAPRHEVSAFASRERGEETSTD